MRLAAVEFPSPEDIVKDEKRLDPPRRKSSANDGLESMASGTSHFDGGSRRQLGKDT